MPNLFQNGKSFLHHVTDKHEWVLGEGGINRCEHELPDADEKGKQRPHSLPDQAIKTVIFNDVSSNQFLNF